MNKIGKYSSGQLFLLFCLRILIGWHLLYEGIAKLLHPDWSSAGFLLESKWLFSGFFHWIVDNNIFLRTVDFLNIWGLIAIGAGLILGLFTKTAAYAGAVLLGLYYVAVPPLIGLTYSIPFEGNYLIVNKTLIEAFALLILGTFPAGSVYGLDMLVCKKEK